MKICDPSDGEQAKQIRCKVLRKGICFKIYSTGGQPYRFFINFAKTLRLIIANRGYVTRDQRANRQSNPRIGLSISLFFYVPRAIGT